MARIEIMVIGIILVLGGLFIQHLTREVEDIYEKCDLCIKDNIEYKCDCKQKVDYKFTTEGRTMFFLLAGLGILLQIINLFIKGEY